MRCACVVALAVLLLASVARADGDPASDVLYTQNAFLPYGEGIPNSLANELVATVAAANKAGYPIKVAVIASRGDLGLVQALWLKPKQYAPFLGRELRFLYRKTLVIVMPNGFGVYDNERGVKAQQRIVDAIPTQKGAKPLAEAMLTAVRNLSTAAGHELGKSGGSSGFFTLDRLLIVGGAIVLLGVLVIARRESRRRRVEPKPKPSA